MEPCAEGDSEPKQLLVVDDEPLVREMLIRLLVGRGFAVLAADNGSAALSLVEQHHQKIGAVLSDVRMPMVDGITLARTLSLLHPNLPIALMSTQIDMSAIEDLGNVRFWFVKPFDTEVLISKVGHLLEC